MFKEKVEFFFFNFFSFWIKLFGLKFARKIGKLLGTVLFYVLPIRKSTVLKNLAFAFPQKTKSELKSLAKKNYQSILITFFEFMYVPVSSKNEIMKLGDFENLPLIKEISESNKGTILFTAHFGNWELGAIAFGILIKKKLYVLAKKQSNTFVNNWLTKAREVHGNKMIWLGPSIRNIIEVLKSGGVVGIVADQRGPIDSPRINFFGRPTAFPIGSATIAAKTNANIIFLVIARKDDFSYKIIYEKVDNEKLSNETDKRALEINQLYANFIEKVVKQNPEQYFWMHNLWKY
ncbi:MAG: lysophospholipid acyltransferase family protein [Stygiobacter sp.]